AQQDRYMYLSVYHWRPMVNGYSGHAPRTVADMRERVTALPSPESVAYLRAVGVRQLLVHPDSRLHPRTTAALVETPGAAVTAFSSGSVVITLPELPRGQELSARLLVPARVDPGRPRAFHVLF